MSNFYNTVLEVLKQDKRFFTEDGDILRNAVYEATMQFDSNLVKALYENPVTRERFFIEVDGFAVFDKIGFGWVVNNRQFLPDSYTCFKNKIGLADIKGEYINKGNDVSLVFPYKDCVLEGGQIKEDQNRDEIFYNETLAPDEVDRLLYPKVFTNAKKYTKDGVKDITEFKNSDNLIIKGNNLLALSSIMKKFERQVKCIYIDPPYYFMDSKDADTFAYNTNFKLSTWMVFMKNRLELAKKLLRPDGVIFVQISDDGQAYLKVLCDEIFKEENFINTISVKMKNIAGASGGGEDKKLKKNIEFIHTYAYDYNYFKGFKGVYDYTELYDLVEAYRENDISWKYTSVLYNPGDKKFVTSTVDGDGNDISIFIRENFKISSINQIAKEENVTEKEVYYKYYDRIFTTAMPQSSIRTRVLDKIQKENIDNEFISIEYTPKTGKNKGQLYEQFYKGDKLRLVTWLKDVVEVRDEVIYKKDLQGTLWDGLNLNNLTKEGGVILANGKKPEALLQRIIEMSTEEGDLILDFFAGAATTAAVAHKINRQYICIEQMDYFDEITKKRIENVIKGEHGGISESINWQGGGSFIYCELKELNQKYVNMIQISKTEEELWGVWEQIHATGFISSLVSIKEIDQTTEDLKKLSFENKKEFFMAVLDKNMLYMNFCDVDDEEFAISENDKAFTKNFYGSGNNVFI